MKIDKICKNVGFDGKDYFCMLCGKAGYSTKEQAMGHLAKCKVRNGVSELPSQPATQLATGSLTNLSSRLPVGLSVDMSVMERLLTVQGQQIEEIKREQAKLSNEATHLMAVNNQSSFDFGGKGLLILVVVGAVFYFLGRENCSCDCSFSGTSRRVKGNSFGSAMAGKIANKVIDKIF